jgi:hypothetical protein
MDEEGIRIPVIAKIEKPQAVENLVGIVDAFDGIMVARGDLGVELPIEDVPLVQKRCVELARDAAKPVIVATQMLDSMIQTLRRLELRRQTALMLYSMAQMRSCFQVKPASEILRLKRCRRWLGLFSGQKKVGSSEFAH